MKSCHFSLSMMTLQQTSNLQYLIDLNSTNSMGINNSAFLVKNIFLKTSHFYIMIHLDVQNMDIEERYLSQYFSY